MQSEVKEKDPKLVEVSEKTRSLLEASCVWSLVCTCFIILSFIMYFFLLYSLLLIHLFL